jgi:hypothetical protein
MPGGLAWRIALPLLVWLVVGVLVFVTFDASRTTRLWGAFWCGAVAALFVDSARRRLNGTYRASAPPTRPTPNDPADRTP